MAQRRMFAKTIVDSDAFLEMPQSSQLLYFHLSMRADDDGFVNQPKAIMRVCGAKDDDLRILVAKKFIIPFESGVVVIKHWRINNYLRSDRYVGTTYQEEKSMLFLDENNAYSLTPHGEQERIAAVEQAHTETVDSEPKISIPDEFLTLYKHYPCSIGKNKKQSLNLYYGWLTGKTITVMGSRKLVKYNHIQMKFALKAFIEANAENEEQFIPRMTTFFGEKTLCDYIAKSRPAYEAYMLKTYGGEWQKVKFSYDKGAFK